MALAARGRKRQQRLGPGARSRAIVLIPRPRASALSIARLAKGQDSSLRPGPRQLPSSGETAEGQPFSRARPARCYDGSTHVWVFPQAELEQGVNRVNGASGRAPSPTALVRCRRRKERWSSAG